MRPGKDEKDCSGRPFLLHAVRCVVPGKPSLQSLWLVDNATRDEDTGKVDVVGMFDQIEVEEPSREFTTQAYLFCALRGTHGPLSVNLRYKDLEDESVLLDRPLRLDCDDPLRTVDVVIRLHRIPVPHAGIYAWELLWENEVIGSSRLTAVIL